MSVMQTLKNIVGLEESDPTSLYRCTDCDNEFESAKDPARVTCLECMGHDVELIEE